MGEQNKTQVIKYRASFLKEGDGLALWYRGGRITLSDDRFVLSIMGIKRISVLYKEILKIEKERDCLLNCIVAHCIHYRIYVQVSTGNRDKLFDELKRRMRAVWEA